MRLDLTDFSQPTPPTRWIYEPWIGRDALTLLLGEGGASKTWLALDLALASSTASPWLGLNPNLPDPVLYVDEDGQLAETCRRVQLLSSGRELALNGSFGHVSPRGLQIDNALDFSRIVETAKDIHAGLIIIDALVRVHSSNENDIQEMKRVMGLLRLMMRQSGCGLLVLHHLAKPSENHFNPLQRARGASEIINASDVAIGMSAHGSYSKLEMLRSRLIPNPAWPDTLKITIEDLECASRVVAHACSKQSEVVALIIKYHLESLTVRETQSSLESFGHRFSHGTVQRAKLAVPTHS